MGRMYVDMLPRVPMALELILQTVSQRWCLPVFVTGFFLTVGRAAA